MISLNCLTSYIFSHIATPSDIKIQSFSPADSAKINFFKENELTWARQISILPEQNEKTTVYDIQRRNQTKYSRVD